MEKVNLIIDVSLCENCNNCVLATKDELVGNEFDGYSKPHQKQGRGVFWIERTVRGSGHQIDCSYRPSMCFHCDNAPCLNNADGAIYKRDDGIVIIDPIKSAGRKDLLNHCPYGAIVWNETENVPQNWFFDAHLLDSGITQTRIQAVCPTSAIKMVKNSDSDMQDLAKKESLSQWLPDLGCKPRVYYKNLARINTHFIAGAVSNKNQSECVEGVEVVLYENKAFKLKTTTDVFGDFKFDGLDPGTGPYRVVINSSDTKLEIDVDKLHVESVNIGLINI